MQETSSTRRAQRVGGVEALIAAGAVAGGILASTLGASGNHRVGLERFQSLGVRAVRHARTRQRGARDC